MQNQLIFKTHLGNDVDDNLRIYCNAQCTLQTADCTQHQRQSNNVSPAIILHSTSYFVKLNSYSRLFASADMKIFIKAHQKLLYFLFKGISSMFSRLLFSFEFSGFSCETFLAPLIIDFPCISLLLFSFRSRQKKINYASVLDLF